MAHGSMGMATMALGLMQPINAFFRPHPSGPDGAPSARRRAWERLHKTSGYTAVLLGFATAALGTMIAGQTVFTVAFPCAVVLVVAVVALAVRDREHFKAAKLAAGGSSEQTQELQAR